MKKVAPLITPFSSLAVLAKSATLTLLFCAAAFAQPMVEGTELAGTRYLLHNSQLLTVSAKGEVKSLGLPKEIGDPKELLKPSEWERSAAVIGTQGIALVGVPDAKPTLATSSEEEGKTALVGDNILWSAPKASQFQAVGPDGQVLTITTGPIQRGPYPLSDGRVAVLLADGTLAIHPLTERGKPELTKLPFVSEKAEILLSGDSVLVWNRDSTFYLVAGHKPRTLPEPPVWGAKSVGDGSFVLASEKALSLIKADGALQTLTKPAVFDPLGYEQARFRSLGTALVAFTNQDQDLVELGFSSPDKAAETRLGKENFVQLIPSPAGQNQPTLLLVELNTSETKVDDSGRTVIDPRTGEPETVLVKGHKLYYQNEGGDWTEIVAGPRARLIGPAQYVGDVFIYATQSEPPNVQGQSKEVDARYPYPPVTLHGIRDNEEVWTFEQPRGAGPSPTRLPEESWPLLKAGGPILLTSESDRLLALDPVTGKLTWSSEPLALDDSRPAMVTWGDTLGVVASNHTTSELLLFGQDGQPLSSARLNTIFNHERTWNLLGVTVIGLALLAYIYLAGKKKLFIRRIAGLEALDEAVGRATEMGKPVLYVTGLADVDDIQTLAALSILNHVAKKTAEYDTSILATTSRAVTFSAAQEVVRDAFTIAGRPDSFSVESVRYISDDQFGYAAGVDGLMVREQPAANFYMGKFYAESLIFAETGNATGAIQIAGTAQANQLPFFVAACDYTLIGEELFAASAYLSGDPLQVGSLRGQDVGKAIVMLLLLVLSLDATFDFRASTMFLDLIGGLSK